MLPVSLTTSTTTRSITRYCIPCCSTQSYNTFRALVGSNRSSSTSSTTNDGPGPAGNNSYIPQPPQIIQVPEPEQITMDSTIQALYSNLPRGEYWDRQPEDLRLLYGTDKESPYKLGKHRSNALELVHRVPVVEVDGYMAICDGGGGGLGHPLEYISLAIPGSINYCKYCSLRYTKKVKK